MRARIALELGRLCLRVRRPAWTIWCLRGTVRREPDNAKAGELFAWALTGAGRLEEAAEVYRGLIAQAREPGAIAVVAWAFASVLLRLDRPADALEILDVGIAAEPRAAKLHHALGRSLMMLGRFEEAVAALEDALTLSPDSRDILGHLAMALTQALGVGPAILEWQASRGAALSKTGRHDEALRAFDAVTAVDPEFFERPRGRFWSAYVEESRRLAR